jgi:hypothetical protein
MEKIEFRKILGDHGGGSIQNKKNPVRVGAIPDNLRKLWTIKNHRRQPLYFIVGDIISSSEKNLESLGN